MGLVARAGTAGLAAIAVVLALSPTASWAGPFARPERLAATPSTNPAIAMDGRGHAVVSWGLAWSSLQSPREMFVRTAAPGRRFGPARSLTKAVSSTHMAAANGRIAAWWLESGLDSARRPYDAQVQTWSLAGPPSAAPQPFFAGQSSPCCEAALRSDGDGLVSMRVPAGTMFGWRVGGRLTQGQVVQPSPTGYSRMLMDEGGTGAVLWCASEPYTQARIALLEGRLGEPLALRVLASPTACEGILLAERGGRGAAMITYAFSGGLLMLVRKPGAARFERLPITSRITGLPFPAVGVRGELALLLRRPFQRDQLTTAAAGRTRLRAPVDVPRRCGFVAEHAISPGGSVWTVAESRNGLRLCRFTPGRRWTGPIRVGAGQANNPSLSFDPTGRGVLAWVGRSGVWASRFFER